MNIGIDIGATKTNIGIVDTEGKIVNSLRISTNQQKSPEAVIFDICEDIKKLLESNAIGFEKINSIGVGVPGTADIRTGFVEYCPNLDWEDVNAGEIFSKHLGIDVLVSQDSRCAAWAEFLFGAGRGYKSFIAITLGTGIGGGIIIDEKIYHGAMNTAGEVGHAVFQKDGRACNCGNHGCLERSCSGTGIIERALERFPEKFENRPKRSETVFELAHEEDEEALALIKDVVADLAVGIANAVSIISPELVVLSGGLCKYERLIIQPLKDLVYHYGYHSWTRKKKLEIAKAELGDEAPMIGAAFLYKSV
jgi:glucokinase